MGTRNSTLVKLGNVIKIEQYGQWDGYPTGVGQEIADFLKTVDLKDFKKKVRALKQITPKQRNEIVAGHEQYFIGANTDWTKEYPQLSRDVGAGILEMVADGSVTKVFRDRDFKDDSIWCEYWYLLDLNAETVTMNGDTFTFEEWTTPALMDYLDRDRDEELSEFLESKVFTELSKEDQAKLVKVIKKDFGSITSLDKFLEEPGLNTVAITINTDNQAFQDGNLGGEVARILRNVATSFELDEDINGKPLKDANGNTVGEVKYVPDNAATTE